MANSTPDIVSRSTTTEGVLQAGQSYQPRARQLDLVVLKQTFHLKDDISMAQTVSVPVEMAAELCLVVALDSK